MSGLPLLARLTCFHQEILRAPRQLNHRLHAVVEDLTINSRHFPDMTWRQVQRIRD